MPISSYFETAVAGLHSYNDFAETVKWETRFVRSKVAEQFLNEVRTSCRGRKETIRKDNVFWRARLGCELEQVITEHPDMATDLQERPYGSAGMKPIRNWNGEGRANPRGIPVLYLATTRDTALTEVRPWIGAMISVAQLVTERELNVIDCSKYHATDNFLRILTDHTKSREDGIWLAIDRAFATPVNKEDEARDYIPTQTIAELFKSEGYDGVVYKSLLSDDGFNVALFDLNDATVVNSSVFRLDTMRFAFSEASAPANFK